VKVNALHMKSRRELWFGACQGVLVITYNVVGEVLTHSCSGKVKQAKC
jgi:hypothetical protein